MKRDSSHSIGAAVGESTSKSTRLIKQIEPAIFSTADWAFKDRNSLCNGTKNGQKMEPLVIYPYFTPLTFKHFHYFSIWFN